MGLKDKLGKLKEGAVSFAKTTNRFNSPDFYGNINRDMKGTDFWEGSYVNIEKGNGVIYGTSQEDYIFTASDIEKFELQENYNVVVRKEGGSFPAKRFFVNFKDGKFAQMDLLADKVDAFKKAFNIK